MRDSYFPVEWIWRRGRKRKNNKKFYNDNLAISFICVRARGVALGLLCAFPCVCVCITLFVIHLLFACLCFSFLNTSLQFIQYNVRTIDYSKVHILVLPCEKEENDEKKVLFSTHHHDCWVCVSTKHQQNRTQQYAKRNLWYVAFLFNIYLLFEQIQLRTLFPSLFYVYLQVNRQI